jgi:hypothetical protein
VKIKYFTLFAASLLISTFAFAARERCGTQRPNSQFYPSTQSRITVGSAMQVPVPTWLTYMPAVRTAALNPIYRPGGGINCEKTVVATGRLDEIGFNSIGYYEYPLNAPLNTSSGVNIDFIIPAYGDNLVDDMPIKFTEFVFNDGRSISLYMMSTEAKALVTELKRNVVVFGEFGNSGDFVSRRQILAVTTLPFYTEAWAGDREYEVKLNWTQGMLTLSTYAYSTFLDPDGGITTPYFITSSQIQLKVPLQTLNSVRVGSIEKTNAFIDGPISKPVLSVESLRWINTDQ